jgi:predicted Zn-dependent protease
MRRCLVLALGMMVAALAGAQDFSTNLQPKTAPGPGAKQREEAQAAMDAHDFETAQRRLAALAAANPKDAHILYDLGSVQDALDEASPAEASYRAAIADDVKFLDPHVALGLLLARAGKLDEARAELQAVKSVATDDKPLAARAYRALARIDEKTRPAEARDELLEALKLTPETPDDTLMGAELAAGASHGAGAAEQAYRRVLATHPDDPAATAELASLLTKQLRAGEAETLLKSALRAHPGEPIMTTELASIYARDGKTAAAAELVQALHDAHPEDANVAHLLAGLYLDSGDYARAEPLLADLVHGNPRDGLLADEYGRALIHVKRFSDAEEVLARVVAQPALFPTRSDLGNAAGDLAFAASSNNDPAATLQALDVRATVLPISAPVLFLSAISHDKLHQVKQAVEAYKAFLAASNGANPDEEFEARHRLVTLEHMK